MDDGRPGWARKADQVVDRMQGIEAGHGAAVADLKEVVLEATATIREKLSDGNRILRESIVKHPTQALGIAVGMGVLLGWLIKRR
jgi:ElaB/YqjD/DUF883 family membrane-anchored ribosome-binding protein